MNSGVGESPTPMLPSTSRSELTRAMHKSFLFTLDLPYLTRRCEIYGRIRRSNASWTLALKGRKNPACDKGYNDIIGWKLGGILPLQWSSWIYVMRIVNTSSLQNLLDYTPGTCKQVLLSSETWRGNWIPEGRSCLHWWFASENLRTWKTLILLHPHNQWATRFLWLQSLAS